MRVILVLCLLTVGCSSIHPKEVLRINKETKEDIEDLRNRVRWLEGRVTQLSRPDHVSNKAWQEWLDSWAVEEKAVEQGR